MLAIPRSQYLSQSLRVRLVVDQENDVAHLDIDHFHGGKEVRAMLRHAAVLGWEPAVDEVQVETYPRFIRYYLVRKGRADHYSAAVPA